MKTGIIAGGGRKACSEIYKVRIRIKAWICWFAAIGLAGLTMEYWDYVGWWGFAPAGLSLVAALVLWRMERPKTTEFIDAGEGDPGKLYRGR